MLMASALYCADYENFYPKEKKEIPKGNEQKSESKGENSYFSAIKMVLYYNITVIHKRKTLFPLLI